MKILYTLLFSLFTVASWGQGKGLCCRYSSQMPVPSGLDLIENETVRNVVVQRIRDDKRIYTLTYFDNQYLFKQEKESHASQTLEVDPLVIFIDFKDSSVVSQYKYDFAGTLYLIKEKTKRYQWNISDKETLIKGRKCYEATLESNSNVKIWFTPEVPFHYGPLGYNDIPGLVMKMETAVYVLTLENVSEITEAKMEIPVKGKPITREAFDKMRGVDNKKLMEKATTVKVIE